MPQEVLEFINAALDNYQSDSELNSIAKEWIKTLDDVVVELEPAELEKVRKAVAVSEEEDKRGYYITHAQIKQKFEEKFAKLRKKKEQVNS
jgi:hypothetical protein